MPPTLTPLSPLGHDKISVPAGLPTWIAHLLVGWFVFLITIAFALALAQFSPSLQPWKRLLPTWTRSPGRRGNGHGHDEVFELEAPDNPAIGNSSSTNYFHNRSLRNRRGSRRRCGEHVEQNQRTPNRHPLPQLKRNSSTSSSSQHGKPPQTTQTSGHGPALDSAARQHPRIPSLCTPRPKHHHHRPQSKPRRSQPSAPPGIHKPHPPLPQPAYRHSTDPIPQPARREPRERRRGQHRGSLGPNQSRRQQGHG